MLDQTTSWRLLRWLARHAYVLPLALCTPTCSSRVPTSAQKLAVSGGATNVAWYIYKDGDVTLDPSDPNANHGDWTNWMPPEAGATFRLNLVDPSNPHSGSTCVRIDVQLEHRPNRNWGGIVVASCPDCWGLHPTEPAYDLRHATKLVFYARGGQGGERIQVKVAVAGDKPHGDSAVQPAATGWITLTSMWQQYELRLEGVDLHRVVTPFAVVTDKAHNPGGPFTFYLDDIYFPIGSGA